MILIYILFGLIITQDIVMYGLYIFFNKRLNTNELDSQKRDTFILSEVTKVYKILNVLKVKAKPVLMKKKVVRKGTKSGRLRKQDKT